VFYTQAEFHALLRHPLTGDVLAATTIAVSDYHSSARELLYSMHVHSPLLMRAAGLLLCSGCLPKVCVPHDRFSSVWPPGAGPLHARLLRRELSPFATLTTMVSVSNFVSSTALETHRCRCMCDTVHLSPLMLL
jgi:hypothetical protein